MICVRIFITFQIDLAKNLCEIRFSFFSHLQLVLRCWLFEIEESNQQVSIHKPITDCDWAIQSSIRIQNVYTLQEES